MTKNKTDAIVATDTEKSVYPDVYAETPSAGDQLEEALQAKAKDTVNYMITIGGKTLDVRNVPVKDNSTSLQATIISTYGGLAKGVYVVDGTEITVTISED